MPRRKEPLANFETYHIFCRSIAKYRIFNRDKEFERMKQLLRFYQPADPPGKFSNFLEFYPEVKKRGFFKAFATLMEGEKKKIQLIAYCLMPTHFHLVIKQLKDNGISSFMGTVMNGYASYFNLRHNRQGPLWQSRFKNVRVVTDDQLLHLTRYVHLNPVTAHLTNKPERWDFSSYAEYLNKVEQTDRICDFRELISLDPSRYGKFTNDRISYQRSLAKIKKLLFTKTT